MSTSQRTPFLSEVAAGDPIPEPKLAYLEQRVLNGFYDYVIGKFLDENARTGLTQAKLARRINRGTDVVSRWLASPGNWQISTLARLLVGIAGEEAVLSSTSLLNRAPRNQTVLDMLDDDPTQPPKPPTGETYSDSQVFYFKPPVPPAAHG